MDLALHQVSVMDVDPFTLVNLAADAGCDAVCVFTNTPLLPSAEGKIDLGFPMVTKAMVPEFNALLKARNIMVGNVEFFPITPDLDLESYREGMEIGQAIGAARLVTHIQDSNFDRAAKNLKKLGDMARQYGITCALEFTPLFPDCATLQSAVDIIKASGSDNVRIGVDALHLERSGGSPADVAAIDPQLIGYAQICDGPLGLGENYFDEALNRKVAGTGQFPLTDLIKVLPAHTAYDVETPLRDLADAGVPAVERVRMAVEGARRLLVHRAV